MVPFNKFEITSYDPPSDQPDMASVWLDTKGRLVSFRIMPGQQTSNETSNWNLVFTRFGVLAGISSLTFFHLLVFYAPTGFSSWHSIAYTLDFFFLITIAIYAFRNSLAGRSIFQSNLM